MTPTPPAPRNRFNVAFGDPPARATAKLRNVMHPWVQEFIRCSPFAVLATANGRGFCSASPRGGTPGFVRVLNERTLLLPELRGNFLFQSDSNIEDCPSVGLMFLIPGLTETVRVSGSARVIDATEARALGGTGWVGEDDLLQALLVGVELAYGHCGRSIKMADLWNVTTILDNSKTRPVAKRTPGI